MYGLQKYLQVSLIIFCCFVTTDFLHAQVLTLENQEEVLTIQKEQGKITSKVLRLFEKGTFDSILIFVDSDYIKSDKNIKKILTTASGEIQKYKDKTEVSEGLIVYDETHNIYRCSYYDTTSEKFLIDIYFMQGNQYSKIVKFVIKKKQELDKEREENIEWNNKHKNPPPPPPKRN